MTSWIVAGVAAVAALVVVLLPREGSVSPDAASFAGLPQVGALFQGAWQSNPHFCSASVVDSPSGDVIVTAAHCLSGNPAGQSGRPVICLNQAFSRRGYPSFRCGGFVNGTSGGPWLADYDSRTGRGDLYGVTGGRYQGGCVSWVSYSSRFDADTMAVYARAVSGGPPDVVPSARPAPC